MSRQDGALWRCHTRVEKYATNVDYATGNAYEVLEIDGNALHYGGVSNIWEFVKGLGSSTPGNAKCYFDNTNAAIGVGDSSTANTLTDTDLKAATNKLRKGMEATYPTHTDGTTSGSVDIVFRSVFGSTDANFAWNEWGVFNSPTAATGRMLNRKVESLGTKASGSTWTLTVTLSLA